MSGNEKDYRLSIETLEHAITLCTENSNYRVIAGFKNSVDMQYFIEHVLVKTSIHTRYNSLVYRVEYRLPYPFRIFFRNGSLIEFTPIVNSIRGKRCNYALYDDAISIDQAIELHCLIRPYNNTFIYDEVDNISFDELKTILQ